MSREAENLESVSDQTASRTPSTNQYGGAPIVFLMEKSLFGDRAPARSEWLRHEELYESIGSVIEATHITGLQRIRGMWRIYVESLSDKVTLLSQGVSIRGKPVELLNTNPLRLDGEGTTRVRVKNIPLSVDDKIITHALIQRGLDVITLTREKLRIKGQLTNCQTGDRLVVVKSLSLKEPLPPTLSFGQFTGRVIHFGQPKKEPLKPDTCSKCLETGHKKADCANDWKCLACQAVGHRKGECPMTDAPQTTPISSDVNNTNVNTPSRESVKPRKTKAKKKDKASGQQVIDSYIQKSNSKCETPNVGRKQNVTERSPPTPAEILNEISKKGKHDTPKNSPNNSSSSDSESGVE